MPGSLWHVAQSKCKSSVHMLRGQTTEHAQYWQLLHGIAAGSGIGLAGLIASVIHISSLGSVTSLASIGPNPLISSHNSLPPTLPDIYLLYVLSNYISSQNFLLFCIKLNLSSSVHLFSHSLCCPSPDVAFMQGS